MNIKRLYRRQRKMRKLILAGMIVMMVACNPKSETFSFDEVTYSPRETVFKLFAPADAECYVQLASDRLAMTLGDDSIWTATAPGDHKGDSYVFIVNGEQSPGVFAKAVTVNGQHGVVVDLRDTDPEGWTQDKRPEVKSPADLVIYEMHHRDFSIDSSSGLKNKGKFLALTEEKAINHLTSLGVNAIHILPSYDFGSIDETRLQDNKYNWGYDPVNYNVPEGSYSTNPYDPLCRIREFKQMVQALHKAGIRVILDVVYNHTYDIEHSNFQRTYPDYYYRTSPSPAQEGEQGKAYSNGSGCGNETASDRPMMRRFMIESVKYWINEYHIDGLRFDLMGVHDIETMNEIRAEVDKIDPTIFIYGEGWSAGQCAYPAEKLATKANTRLLNGIAAFSDDMRDALRGPFSDDTKGAFLAGLPGEEESLKFGIVGAIAHPQVDMTKVNYSKEPWANEPTQQISYVSCHDDMCLVDRLKASVGSQDNTQGNQTNNLQPLTSELIKLDLLAQTAVFTSQGVPFMLSGEEMLRDKKGVHNSFESPDSINHLDWQNLERYPQVFEYYKRLIALRKHHPAFRLGKAELVRKHLEFLDLRSQGDKESRSQDNTTTNLTSHSTLHAPQTSCLVGFILKDNAGDDKWKNIIVILNANREPQTVSIPEGRYTVVCCDGQIDEQGLGEVNGDKVVVDAQSALIIHD